MLEKDAESTSEEVEKEEQAVVEEPATADAKEPEVVDTKPSETVVKEEKIDEVSYTLLPLIVSEFGVN